MEGITRVKLADMLECSESLIRKYERHFAGWLNSPPGKKGVAVAKVFTPEDVRTLSTIHAMRQAGVSFKDIEDKLEDALLTGRYDVVQEGEAQPDVPIGEGIKSERFVPDEDPPGSALVPAGQYALVLGRFQALDEEAERLREELKEERQAKQDALERAAAASATVDERDRLLERLEKIEAQLDEERTKTWWDKVRGR